MYINIVLYWVLVVVYALGASRTAYIIATSQYPRTRIEKTPGSDLFALVAIVVVLCALLFTGRVAP